MDELTRDEKEEEESDGIRESKSVIYMRSHYVGQEGTKTDDVGCQHQMEWRDWERSEI